MIIRESEYPILVSRCFSEACRYDGKSNYHPHVTELIKDGRAIPVCPEALGNLPTPRDPAERQGERVITNKGDDVADHFREDARKTLQLAQSHDCTIAILAKNSPSCGKRCYDGTFTRTLTDRPGVTAELLLENGIKVFSQDDL